MISVSFFTRDNIAQTANFNDILVNGIVYPTPSQIIPTVNIIKNAERSIGGRLQVDITKSKENLRIVFDLLDQDEFNSVMNVFNNYQFNPDGLRVRYFDIYTNSKVTRDMSVMSINFEPLIIDSDIKWQSVVVELEEI
jgi:hypothetical protein